MFDNLMLEGAGSTPAPARLWTLPVAMTLHVAIVAAGVAASYVVVKAIDPEPLTILAQPWMSRAPGPPAGTGSGGGGGLKKRVVLPRPAPQDPQQPMTMPTAVTPTDLQQVIPAVDQGDVGPDGGQGGGSGTGCVGANCVPDGLGTGGEGGPGITGPAAPAVDEAAIDINGTTVVPPRLVTRIEPEYPELARRVRVEGRVVLKAVIGTAGEVEEISVVKSIPLLDDAAIEAVRRWRYEPATLDGRPVKVWFTVAVSFRLE